MSPPPRPSIENLDELPIPDRTLISYKKYHGHIGIAPVRHTVALEVSRGCPFQCLYCHKIWPKKQRYRSVEHIFEEIRRYRDAGVTRLVIVDDVFNMNRELTSELFFKIIEENMNLQIFFPNGLRGDVLTKEYIDLMVEAGTADIDLALESASPRIQRCIRKNLNLERFRENVHHITKNHPHVILEMEWMLGFPTETEEEAYQTFEMFNSFQWVHFPNLNILKIFPGSEIADFAVKHGVSPEAIMRSTNLAFHELPDTLPFSKHFVREYQLKFMTEYFLNKERMLHVLPHQMRLMTEEELVEKYDSYLPMDIKSFADILSVAGIAPEELQSVELLKNESVAAPDFDDNMRRHFPNPGKSDAGLHILLMDLSNFFTGEAGKSLYGVLEPPLGLMALLTWLDGEFGDQITGRVMKSGIDFDSYDELKKLIQEFKPVVIGLRTLSLYKDFFHKAAALIKQWFPGVIIVTGGPYATSEYEFILADDNVDLVVFGEGELTMTELVEKIIEHDGRLPDENVLKNIKGIAFASEEDQDAGEVEGGREVFLFEHLQKEPGNPKAAEPLNPVRTKSLRDTAYLLYTSGSTGVPKAVAMEHGAIMNLISWHLKHHGLSQPARTLQFAAMNFDVSFQEFFTTWSSGGTIILVDEDTRIDMRALWKTVAKECIERMFLPPVALRHLAPFFTPGDSLFIKDVITAGEQLVITDEIRSMFRETKGALLHNHYGPTETHVVTALTLGTDADQWEGEPGIGKPVAGSTIYILDDRMQPVPEGVAGHLYIGGATLARGYLNRPDLTADRFGVDPFATGAGARLYKTGDTGRWLSNGKIEFLGRADHQVKIRGFRIEPGEIETILCDHPSVKEAAAIIKGNDADERELVMYAVATESGEAELMEYLKSKLPDYMTPSAIILLERLPLTSSGKVNRLALKEMADSDPLEMKGCIAPRNQVEVKLALIWREILGIKRVGIRDNFFRVGGHSLKASQLCSSIYKELDVNFPVRDVFRFPTIEDLAAKIHCKAAEGFKPIEPAPPADIYPTSHAQKRLWIIQKMDPSEIAYNMGLTLRFDDQDLNVAALKSAFASLVGRHETLRTAFVDIDGVPFQKIPEVVEPEISTIDLTKVEDAESRLKKLIADEHQKPFDLSRPSPIRLMVVTLGPDSRVVTLAIHHIVGDGWSFNVMEKEFRMLYDSYCRGLPNPLAPLKIQYKDFALWQHKRNFSREENYWLKKLQGAPTGLELPYDFQIQGDRRFQGGVESIRLEGGVLAALREMGAERNATLSNMIFAIYMIFLFRLTKQNDICVGMGVAGRNHKDLEPLIGFFVNALPVRIEITGDMEFEEVVDRVSETVYEALDRQDYPFDLLTKKMNPERYANRQPLFNVTYVFQNTGDINIFVDRRNEAADCAAEDRLGDPESVDGSSGTSKFDLTLFCREEEESLTMTLEYDSELFLESTIERFLGFMENVAKGVAAQFQHGCKSARPPAQERGNKGHVDD